MDKKNLPTEKGAAVLNHLKNADGALTGAEIAAATDLNPQGIHGVLNGLFRKGWVSKEDPVTIAVLNKDGVEEDREYVTYAITAAGAEVIVD